MMASRLLLPLMSFVFFAVLALNFVATAPSMAQSHGISRMVLLDEDQQPSLFLLLGPNGWVQQQATHFSGSAAPRNRYPTPVNGDTSGNKDETAEGKVEKKWSRFEPSIRFF